MEREYGIFCFEIGRVMLSGEDESKVDIGK